MAEELKSNLNKATNQNFQMIFPLIPTEATIRDSEILTLNIHGTVLPSMTVSTVDVGWQGGHYPQAIAPIEFEPWFTNFEVDSKFENWYKIYKWINFINNNEDHYDRKPEDVWVDAKLHMTDNFDRLVMYVNIYNIYPTSLGEISFSYREGTENIQSSVSFNYTRYEVFRVDN
jgi:hypothetical protein